MEAYDVEKAITFISDDLLQRFAFAGTPDELTAQALALIEAGCDRIEFGTPHGLNPETGLALLGEKVLPQIRENY
jgi:5,10-methylenetetrahydromethanopterin reductase